MVQIPKIPHFIFPGTQYLPDIVGLPERTTDVDYESLSKWLVDGLSFDELLRQAEPVLSRPVVRYDMDTGNYCGSTFKAKFNTDFALKIYHHLQRKPIGVVEVTGDDWYSLSFITRGSYRGRVGDRDFQYPTGSCVLVHYSTDQFFAEVPVPFEPGACVDIMFRAPVLTQRLGLDLPELRQRLGLDDTNRSLCGSQSWCQITPRMMSVLDELLSCSMTPDTFHVYAEGKALELLTLYLVTLAEKTAQEDQPPQPEQADILLQHARQLLAENYLNPPSIGDLSDTLGLSRSRLTRQFKLRYGETIYEFVQRQRMEKAQELLVNTQLNIDQVALRVGYRDPASFRKVFHRHFGVLPRNYKAKLLSTP